jgi:hypothetical protein
VPAYQSFYSQTLVLTAEVVNRPYQIHPCFKRFVQARYGSPSSYKARQALSERRIEPLYEGCVDYSSTLRPVDHSFNFGAAALNDSPVNSDNSPLLVLLNRLRNEDSLPPLETRAACLPTPDGLAKNEPNRSDIRLQPVCAEQDASAQGRSTGSHLINHISYKSAVALACYYPAQPKPRAYHQSQSHPCNSALEFYAKLVHLHLTQITRRGNQQVVDRQAMLSGTDLPTCYRALIEIECCDNGLNRTAKGKQSDNLRDKLLRMAKAVKWTAFGFGKSLSADRALVAPLFERVNADIGFIDTASGRTVHIRTKYSQWVQLSNPFQSDIQKGLSLDPSFIQKHLLHLLLWSYRELKASVYSLFSSMKPLSESI